jgi:hypothetical protein
MYRMTSNRWNLQLCEPFSDSVPPKPESKLNMLLQRFRRTKAQYCISMFLKRTGSKEKYRGVEQTVFVYLWDISSR